MVPSNYNFKAMSSFDGMLLSILGGAIFSFIGSIIGLMDLIDDKSNKVAIWCLIALIALIAVMLFCIILARGFKWESDIKKKNPLFVTLVLVLLAAIGGLYWLLGHWLKP